MFTFRLGFTNAAAFHGTAYGAFHDVTMGLLQGFTFILQYLLVSLEMLVVHPIKRAFGIKFGRAKARDEGYETNNTLKVAVVGYGRTGTVSLYMALSELGYQTYHSFFLGELIDVLGSFHEDFVMPSIQSGQVQMNNIDLQFMVQQGYEALVDQPTYYYYEQMMKEYPDCKFILTTRESPQAWYKSYSRMMSQLLTLSHLGSQLQVFRNFPLIEEYARWGHAVVSGNNDYLTGGYSTLPALLDQEAAMASYVAHNEKVRQIIPADRLLEFQVHDGWEPLCDFLGMANCPSTPFPRANSKLFLDSFCAGGTATAALLIFVLAPTLIYKASRTALRWTRPLHGYTTLKMKIKTV